MELHLGRQQKIQHSRLRNSLAGRALAALAGLALATLPAACQKGAAIPTGKQLAVMTALPLFPASADVSDILNGPDQRSAVIKALEGQYRVVPLARLDQAQLGRSTLILAQPRGLGGDELVALDGWVRDGGTVLIFTDPELVWPVDLPLGDPRRAPPIGLLDPLLAHWALDLVSPAMTDTGPIRQVAIGTFSVAVAWAGEWRTRNPGCRIEANGLIADCSIGKGKALLVADADILDQRLWQSSGAQNESAILALVRRVAASEG